MSLADDPQEHHPSGNEDSMDTEICCQETTGATEEAATLPDANRV